MLSSIAPSLLLTRGATMAAPVSVMVATSTVNGFPNSSTSGLRGQNRCSRQRRNAELWLAPNPRGTSFSTMSTRSFAVTSSTSGTFRVRTTVATSGHSSKEAIKAVTISPCPWLTIETQINAHHHASDEGRARGHVQRIQLSQSRTIPLSRTFQTANTDARRPL